MAVTAIRFKSTEFSEPREVVVNPLLVSAAGSNEHGVTYIQTAAGRILVSETLDEVLKMLEWESPADLRTEVAPALYPFDANGQIVLNKQITALVMTNPGKSITYVYDTDYTVDAKNGVVAIIPPPPPAVKPPPGTPPIEPVLKPGQIVSIGYSYLKPEPPPPPPKDALLTSAKKPVTEGEK